MFPVTGLSTKAHALIRRNVQGIAATPRHPEFSSMRTKTLDIDNIVYQSPIFRKIHLEVAVAEKNVYIMHLVLHPHVTRSLPILSMDVVVLSGRPTMCIADPCPVTADLSLPAAYRAGVIDLQRRHGIVATRELPEWGREIFSDACIITRGEDYERFQEYALDLLDYHLREAAAWPVDVGFVNTASAAHERYRRFQLKNDRTRKMLTGAFDGDAAKAEEYMNYVFD